MRRTQQTQAQRIAALLGNDGMRRESVDGRTLDELAREAGARAIRGEDRHCDSTRYEWPDGSAIVDSHGSAWDFVHPACECGFCGKGWGIDCRETIQVEGMWLDVPTDEADRAAELVRASDDEGTIQAEEMVTIFPGEPTRHTTTTLATALAWIGARVVD